MLHFTTAFDQVLANSAAAIVNADAATAVPEPSSAVLAIAGLFGLAPASRRPGG